VRTQPLAHRARAPPQGTILDRIDFNMEQVIESTKDGVAQLHKAEASQKQAMPVKCIAALLCLIAVLVLLLIVKHR
jgi:syntaxin 16